MIPQSILSLRAVVCDDEAAARELIKKYLTEWAALRAIKLLCREFESAESFLFAWDEDGAYDLLVLGIEMPGLNGIELARRLRAHDVGTPILFVTGYDSYMAQGYDVATLHYLLKPIRREKLFEVLERLQNSRRAEQAVLLPTKLDGMRKITLDSIWYLEAQAHSCMLHTRDEALALRLSISEAAKRLAPYEQIVGCHRSYLVNLTHVSSLARGEVILDDGQKLPLSRSRQGAVHVHRTGGRFLSVKEGAHGFGLLRVDGIVDKYNGLINRQTEDGVFATEITLPLAE